MTHDDWRKKMRATSACEQIETRVLDLLKHHPELELEAVKLLMGLDQQRVDCPCIKCEFSYYVGWLGLHMLSELTEQRYTGDLDDEQGNAVPA